jgi:hypothetical protein
MNKKKINKGGRPKKKDKMSAVQISLYPREKGFMQEVTRINGLTVSAMGREAIGNHLLKFGYKQEEKTK